MSQHGGALGPRALSPQQAAPLAAQAPAGCLKVGVLVDPDDALGPSALPDDPFRKACLLAGFERRDRAPVLVEIAIRRGEGRCAVDGPQRGAEDGIAHLAPDLAESVAFGDARYADIGFLLVKVPADGNDLVTGLTAALSSNEGAAPVQPALSAMNFATAIPDPGRIEGVAVAAAPGAPSGSTSRPGGAPSRRTAWSPAVD